MTPVELAQRLIANQPDEAETLLCFLVWATELKDEPEDEAALEEVEEFLYSKTPHSRVNREAHRRLLIRHVTSKESITSIGP